MRRKSQVQRQRVFSGDEARGAVERQIKPGPLSHHQQSILKLNNVKKVDEDPDEPGGQARDLQPVQIGDGGEAAYGGEIPFVEIMERFELFATKTRANHFRDISTLLDGRLRDAGKRLAGLMAEIRQIADDEYLRVARYGHVRFDQDAAGFVERRAGILI